MNKIKKILLATVFFLMAFSWSSFSQYAALDYGSIATGDWGTASTWMQYNTATSAFDIPVGSEPSATDNVWILAGTTVTVEANSKNCANLNVEAGAQLAAFSGAANRYIDVNGNIVCDGTIGNGTTFDCLSFNINGATVSISGATTGVFDASVIRKNTTINAATNLTISRNINLRNSGAAATNIYNGATGTATRFNVTVAAGDTVTLVGTATGSASIDGTQGNGGSEAYGIFTINGVMDVQGILYLKTTNNTTAGDSCKWVITGELKAYSIDAAASFNSNARGVLVDSLGGKLNLTGAPAWSALSTTNNSFRFLDGSTVEYSALGAQTVKTATDFGGISSSSYYNLIISGTGNKTTSNSISSVRNDLTITNATGTPVLILGTNQQLLLGGNWTNYDQSGFTEGTSAITVNGATSNQFITCAGAGGEIWYRVTLNKATSGTVYLGSDLTLSNTGALTNLLFNGVEKAPLDLNKHKLIIPNNSVNAIQGTLGALNSHYIISETDSSTNPSIIKWTMGLPAAAYTFPFGVAGSYIPVIIGKKATATTVDVSVSTRSTATSNNQPWDTLVTNMSSFFVTGNPDASDTSALDRWWNITPSVLMLIDSMKLTYRGSENTIEPAYRNLSVYPETFDVGASSWRGKTNPVTNGVTAGTGTVATFNDTLQFGPWVVSAFLIRLPINLLEFTATLKDGDVITKWTTASETNNKLFTVERSRDSKLFEEAGHTPGAGTTSETHFYSLADDSPYEGLSYYRLRQTDLDGHFTFSETVPVLNKSKNSTWYIFPNPATDVIRIGNTANDRAVETTFELFNPEGSVVKSLALGAKNQTLITVDISAFSKGVYIGKITDAYHQEVFKIVKN